MASQDMASQGRARQGRAGRVSLSVQGESGQGESGQGESGQGELGCIFSCVCSVLSAVCVSCLLNLNSGVLFTILSRKTHWHCGEAG